MRSRVLVVAVAVLSGVVVSCAPNVVPPESAAPQAEPAAASPWDLIGVHPFAPVPFDNAVQRVHVNYAVTSDLRRVVCTRDHYEILTDDVLSGRPVPPAPGPRVWGRYNSRLASPPVYMNAESVPGVQKNAPTRYVTRLFSAATPTAGALLAEDVTDGDVMPMGVTADGRLAFVADGHVLAAWDTATLRRVQVLSGIETKPNMRPQAFEVMPSPHGRYVAVLQEAGCSPHIQRFCGLDFVPQPYHLNRGDHGRIRIWDTAEWKVTFDFRNDGYAGHEWAADGRFVSRTYHPNRTTDISPSDPLTFRVELRNPAGEGLERRIGVVPTEGFYHRVAASGDGRIAVGLPHMSRMSLVLHDLTANRPPRTLPTPDTVADVAFAADARFLLVWFNNGTSAMYDLCGVTTPPADYTAARLWDDLKADDPPTVYRAVRWALAHPDDTLDVLANVKATGDPLRERWVNFIVSHLRP